jgi:hypothetical protein
MRAQPNVLVPRSVSLFILAFAFAGLASSQAPAGDGAGLELGAPLSSSAAHARLLEADQYPSATKCAACHEEIFKEWSSSAHAYAAISPMFHKFEQRINDLANGTIGAFCVRCHISVGTSLGEERWRPLSERAPVSLEGVTCITCHRVDETYGRVNGERRIVPGALTDPIYGPTGAPNLDPEVERLKGTSTEIHRDAFEMKHLSKSEFCASCHQVAVHPGIKLEVVWEQYRDSPAAKAGTTCQDCHMSSNPGLPNGYGVGPRARIGQRAIGPENAKHTDHSFVGPGYTTAHPGIFPHRPSNNYSFKDWMSFNWRRGEDGGWGDKEWESKHGAQTSFPEAWKDEADRREAREIVEENLKRIDDRNARRLAIMENGSKLDGPFFRDDVEVGEDLEFEYVVTNICTGHNLPSGSLGAQPEIWLNVALTDPDGKNVWESGYVDSFGDMADLHSRDVLAGTLPHDDQLFNLQSKFLTTNVKGTDREMYLPVPFDGDQLPFIRPAGQPTSVMNHPPFIRMEQRSIPPLGNKKARYEVPGELLKKPGTYKLSARLRSRAEPIYFMDFVGATKEMVREMNRNMIDIHPYTVAFEVR